MKRSYVVLIILLFISASDYLIYLLTLQPTILVQDGGLLLGRSYLFVIMDIGIIVPITIAVLSVIVFRHKIMPFLS